MAFSRGNDGNCFNTLRLSASAPLRLKLCALALAPLQLTGWQEMTPNSQTEGDQHGDI